VNVKAIPDHAYDPSTTTEHPLQPAVDIPSSLMEPNATISNSAVSDPDGQSAAIGLSNELSAVNGSPTTTEKDAVPSTSYKSQPTADGPSASVAIETAVESAVIPSLILLLLYEQQTNSPLSQLHLLLLSRFI